MLSHFKKAVEERRRQVALHLLEGGVDSHEKYMWHVGYSAGMLEAINLLQEIVDASYTEE